MSQYLKHGEYRQMRSRPCIELPDPVEGIQEQKVFIEGSPRLSINLDDSDDEDKHCIVD